MFVKSSACCLSLILYGIVYSVVDQTRQYGAIGSKVVDAVVNIIRESCLFADDKRFLVRLAYVQSHDGYDSKTFRNGYHGGIWQIDENMFLETKNAGRLSDQFNIISSQFSINWNTVMWSDLRKSLYSGIADALYTILHGGTQWRVEDQAHFYETYFVHLAGDIFINESNIVDKGFHSYEKLDLAFVLESNSLTNDDFLRLKYFVQIVVDSFDIAPDKARISVVTCGSNAQTEFLFNNYGTKSDVKNAIMRIPLIGGSTAIADAINLARTNIFNVAHGSRPDAVKVMVVITDSDANDLANTGHATAKAHREGITVFSIGVGRQVQKETLNTIASNPDCTHVFSVSNYALIKAMKEEIQRTPVYIDGLFCCKIEECPALAHHTPRGGVTLESNMTCGAANIYTAFSNQYPSQSFYEEYGTVSSGNPGLMFVNSSTDKTLYLNMVDALRNNCGSGDCEICVNPKDSDQRDYGNGGVSEQLFTTYAFCSNCEAYHAPCTVDNIRSGDLWYPVMGSIHQYIQCDLTGRMYLKSCPTTGLYYFYDATNTCVGGPFEVSVG